MSETLVITPIGPIVNLTQLVDVTVAATPLDDLRKHEIYVGFVDEVKVNRMGTFVRFQCDTLVGKKWIPVSKLVGYAHVAETAKATA